MSVPSHDLLGAVAEGVGSQAFSEVEAVVILHTLLSAGGESTTSLIGNAVRILAEDRDLQGQLRESPELIPMFVEEALRLEPPFRYHMRHVPNDTELGGVEIPAGATVLLLWGAANRDGAMFDHPESIDLTREAPGDMWRSVEASITASGRPLLGSRRGTCSAFCLRERVTSPSILDGHRDG